MAKRLGMSDKSLYYWVSKAKKPTSQSAEQEEIRKLKAELKHVTEERNILKEAAVDLNPQPCTLQASQTNVHVHKIRTPNLSRQHHVPSVYSSPRITHELRYSGETCGENRVAKLMKQAKLRANIGYKRRYFKSAIPSVIADNHLQQQFVVCEPDEAWVADITYIKTYEGWLYLAVVVDLFSRKVIGWSMQSTMTSDIVVKAMIMTIWRRPEATGVVVHTDQGSQYASGDYRDFLAAHNLKPSMSRRGHCLDNAVAESFFHSLKTE